jgi:hypothetical protein
MTPHTFITDWLAARTAGAMRRILADPALVVPVDVWPTFWVAYPADRLPGKSPATRFAGEQAAAAEDALAAAVRSSPDVARAVARSYTPDYWLDVYGGVARELIARRQARYLVALTGPGWPSRPAWRSADVLDLTRAITATGNVTLMPILADALEEAGCQEYAWLALMRDPTHPWFTAARLLRSLASFIPTHTEKLP